MDFVYQEEGLNIMEAKYKEFKEPEIEHSVKQAIKSLQPSKVRIANLSLKKEIVVNDQRIKFVESNNLTKFSPLSGL